jgi:hypothetical protein
MEQPATPLDDNSPIEYVPLMVDAPVIGTDVGNVDEPVSEPRALVQTPDEAAAGISSGTSLTYEGKVALGVVLGFAALAALVVVLVVLLIRRRKQRKGQD